jgi:H+-transporting ATPase
VERDVERLGERGIRSLAVAKTNTDGAWEMAGLLTFLDPPRPDTKQTIDRAREYGVEVKMVTGDHLLIAKETARQLGMGQDVRDASMLPKLDADGKPPADLLEYFEYVETTSGFAQVFPEHKFLIVEVLRRGGYKVRSSLRPWGGVGWGRIIGVACMCVWRCVVLSFVSTPFTN